MFFRIAALWLLLLMPLPASADQADAAFGKAKAGYRALLDTPKKQQYRENWDNVIQDFLAVAKSYPASDRAAAGLYMAGKTCQGLYGASHSATDAAWAAKIFDRVDREYSNSSLADDALFEAAQLYELELNDKGKAFERYQAIINRYPKGDMLEKARSKAAALVVFVPVPKPTPMPSAKPGPVSFDGDSVLSGVEFWSKPGYTRIVMNLERPADYQANVLKADAEEGVGPRIYVDLKKTAPAAQIPAKTSVQDGLLRQIRVGRYDQTTTRVVADLVSLNDYKTFAMFDPYRIVIDIYGGDAPVLTTQKTEISSLLVEDQAPVKPKPSTAAPTPKQIHKPTLRRIVVDAGHGGKDPGAIGPSGLKEKDITLAMAKELKRQLGKELDCEVILTRKTDVYLSLDQRTALANKVGADLFISIHANASLNRSAYGVETYYLNFSKNDKAAAVAARENGTSLKQVGDLELILFDLMANAKINESSRLAAEIQNSLIDNLGRSYSDIRNLGVKQGPFYVLVGATMPSVLVEAAFISHKREESRLASRKFQETTGAAIVRGVRNYASDLKLIASK